MKKQLLTVLLAVHFAGAQEDKKLGSAIVNDFLDDTSVELQQEKVGEQLIQLCSDPKALKEVIPLILLELNQEQIKCLSDLLKIMMETFKIMQDPLFIEELDLYKKIDEILKQQSQLESLLQEENFSEAEKESFRNGLITEKEKQALLVKKDECSRVNELFELLEQLKFFQNGLAKGAQSFDFESVLQTILEGLQA